MSKPIVIAASAFFVVGLGATFAITRFGATAAACGATAVAGGDIGGPFELVSETGETVTSADVITEPTLVYFGYTFCPDVCPLDAARNAAAVDILAEQGISVTPLFITIDPARDTPEVVGNYTDNFHPKMIGLTGSDEQVDIASKAYRTYYQKADNDPEYYLMNHSTFTYLVTPDQGFVEFFKQPTPAEEVAEITACYVTSA